MTTGPSSRNTFLIHLGPLTSAGRALDVTCTGVLEGAEVLGVNLVADPVTVTAHLESTTDEVKVSGVTRAAWSGECRRCLKPLGDELVAEFDTTFSANPSADDWPLDGASIDLSDLVRETLVFALPLPPACDDDCDSPSAYEALSRTGGAPELQVEADGLASDADRWAQAAAIDPRWAGLSGLDLTE